MNSDGAMGCIVNSELISCACRSNALHKSFGTVGQVYCSSESVNNWQHFIIVNSFRNLQICVLTSFYSTHTNIQDSISDCGHIPRIFMNYLSKALNYIELVQLIYMKVIHKFKCNSSKSQLLKSNSCSSTYTTTQRI